MLEEWGGLGGAVAVGLLLGGLWLWACGARSESSRGSVSGARRSRAGAAAETLLRVVHAELERGHNEAAVAHWLALGAAGLEAHAGATLAIRMAALLRDGGRNEEAAAALRCALRSCDGRTGFAVAARVARAAMDLDPGLALDACAEALASDALDPLDRRDLERLQARLQCASHIEPSNAARAADRGPASADPEPVAAAVPAEAPARPEPMGPAASAEAPARPEPMGPAASAAARIRPEPIELGHHARRLAVELALPLAFEPAGLRVALEAGEQRVLAWREIDAIAVGAVEGLGPKPVLVVDLVAGWRLPACEPLRIVRLRGDRFDPRKVVHATGSPVDALRELVDRLLGETGAEPLPDLRAARGRPFAGFRDLTAFEEDVLVAEEGGSAASRARSRGDPGPA